LQKHLQTIFPQFLTFFSSRSSVLLWAHLFSSFKRSIYLWFWC
jgi:hypothetical protein